MRVKDLKEAIFEHFSVTTFREFRLNEQWQDIACRHGLTSLRTRSDWEAAYNAVFPDGQGIFSEEADVENTVDAFPNQETKPSTIENSSSADNENSEQVALHEMRNREGDLVGALLEYSPDQSKQLIEHFKDLKLHSPEAWHQGALNSTVVDQLGFSSSVIFSGLQAGKIFRVIGTPELVSQISSGAAQLMQTSGGVLGTVTSGGKIIGQLRFAPAGLGAALPILAPLIAYQMLHAIVGTRQLNQINQHLAKIEHTLQELHVRHEATILGEIQGAVETLDDILDSRMHTGSFSTDAIARLASVERTIRAILARNKILVDRFNNKADNVKSAYGKKGARGAAELLKADGTQAVYDMQCLVGLIAAELKLEQALLLLAMQTNPTDVGRRQERIRSKMQSHHELMENFPSVKGIEQHAKSCIQQMKRWERLFDGWQAYREVEAVKNLNLEDVQVEPNQLETGLSGYIFWRDDEGTHVFSMSGEDLQFSVDEGASQPALDTNLPKTEKSFSDQKVLEVTVQADLLIDRHYKLRLPGISELVEVFVEEEIEPNLWTGYHQCSGTKTDVIIRHKDYYRPSSTYKPNWTMPRHEPVLTAGITAGIQDLLEI